MAVMNNASTNNADSVIGEGFYSTTASMSGYQQVTVPVSYTNGVDVPTKVVIAFVSGSTSGGGDSSTLYVDDVSFSTVGVNDLASAASVVKTYPNPAGNTLHLETAIEGNMVWEAFDMQGRKLKTETFSGKKTLDISALAPGLYGYRISSPDGKSLQAGVFSVSR